MSNMWIGPSLPDERLAELADAGAGVEHEHRAVIEPHLHARRVAPVADGAGARGSEGATAAPDDGLQRQLDLEATAEGQRTRAGSSACANSSSAVTAMRWRTPSLR